jgi:hypothetical protein
MGWGVCERALKPRLSRKDLTGKAKVKTGIGKSDFPGLQGGPRKRDSVFYDKVRAPRLYPDPGNWFAPPGSNRNDCRGNEAVGAFGVEGRKATRRACRP